MVTRALTALSMAISLIGCIELVDKGPRPEGGVTLERDGSTGPPRSAGGDGGSGGSAGSAGSGGSGGSGGGGGGSSAQDAGGARPIDAAAGDRPPPSPWPGCGEPVMSGYTPAEFCPVYEKVCGFGGNDHWASLMECMTGFKGGASDGDACKAGHLCRAATVPQSAAMKESDCATSAKAACRN